MMASNTFLLELWQTESKLQSTVLRSTPKYYITSSKSVISPAVPNGVKAAPICDALGRRRCQLQMVGSHY